MDLFIPIDFSIEFWNCIFPPTQKFLEGIFWTGTNPGSVATSVQKLLTVFTAQLWAHRLVRDNFISANHRPHNDHEYIAAKCKIFTGFLEVLKKHF